LLTIVQNIHFL